MEKTNGQKIIVTRDGPYEVVGDVDISLAAIGPNASGASTAWIEGRKFTSADKPDPDNPVTHLCRCGHSHAKPFCDGTHEDAEFCGQEKPDAGTYRERAEVQIGDNLILRDDNSLCVGARFCDVGASVWNLAYRSADPEKRALAIQETANCPSGRITVTDMEGREIEPELPRSIAAVQDPVKQSRGPLWVRGGIPIEAADGTRYEVRNRVTLCRCGQSENQPYCDSTHYFCEHMQGMDE